MLTIDLIIKAHFSNSLLQCYSHFLITNISNFLISQRYLPTLFFLTNMITFLPRTNDTFLLLSPNLFYILFSSFSPFSIIFLLELYLSRLDLKDFDLSQLNLDQKFSYYFQKSLSYLYFLKNLLFCRFFLFIFQYFLISAVPAIMEALYYMHFLLGLINKNLVPNYRI